MAYIDKMVKTTIITVGKAKEKFIREGVEEYAKRLGKDIVFKQISQSNKSKEAKEFLKYIESNKSQMIIALDEKGAQLTSLGFAELIKKNQDTPLCFIIGGPDGLDPSVLSQCKLKLSLSSMTMPHELALLVFIEQYYRAQTIIDGKTYHRQ